MVKKPEAKAGLHSKRSFACCETVRLDAAAADMAFAVVQAVRPDIDAEAWREHAAELLDAPDAPEGGSRLIGLRGPRGYLHGLFSYSVGRRLPVGRVLRVEDFCVATIVGWKQAARTLLAAAEDLARNLDCGAISVTPLAYEEWTGALPNDAISSLGGGYVADAPNLLKQLD